MPLFDQVIGTGNQRGWHGNPECHGSLEIEHKLEFGRLLYWKISRPAALEYLVNEGRSSIVELWVANAVAHQSTVIDKYSIFIDGRQFMPGCKVNDLPPIGRSDSVYSDNKRLDLLINRTNEHAAHV